ncbi:MAG: GNAT family N-acetyltransferase [Chitinophagales bacterium]
MIFKTKRLAVRLLQFSDINAYFDLHGNINVMQYTTGKTLTFEQTRKNLKATINYYKIPNNKYQIWAIQLLKNPELIGTCAIISTDQKNEIGYRLRENYWTKGYGEEIAKGLIKYCFEDLKLDSIFADADVLNIASVKILDKTMDFVKEYYIAAEDCTAREYRLTNTQIN